jgi:murein DD-endopeptidase MepM/ murein hydrolase activator NlpD
MKKNRLTHTGILLFLIPLFFSCTEHSPEEGTDNGSEADSLAFVPAPVYHRDDRTIRRNERLADILEEYGIPYETIHRLAADTAFDVRRMRSGHNLDLFFTGDSLRQLHHMVYRHEPREDYVFHLLDSVYIELRHKPVRYVFRSASGRIETSLWECIMEQELHPNVAVELSEIYAWSIDFFGLQQGDYFKILYEEAYVDSVSTGDLTVYGACFYHGGDSLYAFPFYQKQKHSFFDRFGNSLRKQFLKAPLQFSRISSGFSYNRLHPILKIRRPHLGVDYAAPRGTPVHAVGDGIVTQAAYLKNSGRIVRIRHNSVYSTAYLHLSGYGRGIRSGVHVRQGDIIGYVGSTGLSTGQIGRAHV